MWPIPSGDRIRLIVALPAVPTVPAGEKSPARERGEGRKLFNIHTSYKMRQNFQVGRALKSFAGR